MKRRKGIVILCVFALFVAALLFAACEEAPDVPPAEPSDEPAVTVTALSGSVELYEQQAENYDFTALFAVSEGDMAVPVTADMLTSTVQPQAGQYKVTCSYKGKSAEISVTVRENVYRLSVAVSHVTVKESQTEKYDFLSLFTAQVNGETVALDLSAVQSDLRAEIGEYFYKVTFHGQEKQVAVRVVADVELEAVRSYVSVDVELSALSGFDFTSLFSLYADGEAKRVTPDMLTVPDLTDKQAGDVFDVSFFYAQGKYSCTSAATVRVVADAETTVVCHDVSAFPNSGDLDLTTLFTVTKGGAEIAVTDDMINGTVDYTEEGVNEIVLLYGGDRYVATVTVRFGVQIAYATSDVVIIKQGTDRSAYDFAYDFVVKINGIRFRDVAMYFDAAQLAAADFSAAGTYPVTLKIPYNNGPVTLDGANWTYTQAVVTYVVVSSTYRADVIQPSVILTEADEGYDLSSNLFVTVDNKLQSLTTVKEWANNALTTYYEVVTGVDFTSVGTQEVKLALYVYGADEDPVFVTYNVVVQSDVRVEATDAVVYTGDTVYARNLFRLYDGDAEIPVTDEMVSGKADVFTAGTYVLSFRYRQLTAQATVLVLDSEMLGTYHTKMTTIAALSSSGSSGSWEEDDGWGEYNEEYDDEQQKPEVLGDLVITRGGVTLNGVKATSFSVSETGGVQITLRNEEYSLHYEDGVAVLLPQNRLKMQYSDASRRPYLYVRESTGAIGKYLTFNSSSSGEVLQLTNASYTLYVFRVDGEEESFFYGLKTELVEHSGSDYVYDNRFGRVTFAEGFTPVRGVVSSLTFLGETYAFSMTSGSVAKVVGSGEEENPYKGMTFTGTVDGQTATLEITGYGAYSLTVGGKETVRMTAYELANALHSGLDLADNTVLLYSFGESPKAKDGCYSYKLRLSPQEGTFEYLEKDALYGKFFNADGTKFVFFDGYGTGIVNFATGSYYRYEFTYSVQGGVLLLRYFNTKSTFAYGEGAAFYVQSFGNVLTVKSSDGGFVPEEIFDVAQITDGAKITVSSYTIGADVQRAEFLEKYLEIATKDGVLTAAEKDAWSKKAQNYKIDLRYVAFGTAGTYQFTVTVEVGGEKVTNYFALQILARQLKDHPLVADYGEGVLLGVQNFTIDVYGRFSVTADTRYTGRLNIDEETDGNGEVVGYTFVGIGRSDDGARVTVRGTQPAEGVLRVNCSGALTFTEYFTTRTVRTAGTSGAVLRRFAKPDDAFYVLSDTAQSAGEIASVTVLNGADVASVGVLLEVTTARRTLYVKIADWNSADKGLILADAYRGTYQSADGGENAVLDGFGTAQIGGETLSYSPNSRNSAILGEKLYKFDFSAATYAEATDVTLDKALLAGKTFTATYYFGQEVYAATTKFAFDGENVVVSSESAEYEENGETYAPDFAAKKGNYTVVGNRVTVTVGGATFVLEMDDVYLLNALTVRSTTLSSDDVGYFSVGALFVATQG